jgi:hypothetical protein
MVCPKCGFNGPDGVECGRCGVVVDKYRRSGTTVGAPGAVSGAALPIPKMPSRAAKERPKRPIGHTIAWGFGLIVLCLGLGVLFDYMRLHLMGNRLHKAMNQAMVPKSYGGALMTADQVLERVRLNAKNDNLDLPLDRLWIRVQGSSAEMGELVTVTVRAHLPMKLIGFIKFPVVRTSEMRFSSRLIPHGYARSETDPNAQVSKDLAASGALGKK